MKSVVRWVLIGAAALVALALAHVKSATPRTLVWLAVAAFIAIAVIRLVRGLGKKSRSYYALVIETAGTPRTALVSDSRAVVVSLVNQIMDAIDDASASFVEHVNNFYNQVGDNITQYGDNNIGMIKNQATADPHAALAEMISLLDVLRAQVSAADRKIIDESLAVVRGGNKADKRTLRTSLGDIAGIAALAGEVGVPVIEAVRKVIGAFGLT